MVEPHDNIVIFPARYRPPAIHRTRPCPLGAHAALRLALLHRFVTQVEGLAPPMDDEAGRREACRRVRLMLDEIQALQDLALLRRGDDE